MHVKTITKDDFSVMTKTEKVGHVFGNGRELLSRKENGYTISLYILDGFFVEVWYKDPEKKIEMIELSEVDAVELNYGNQIDLTNLY